MPTITIPTFKGMTPRTHKRLLGPADAQDAVNCRTERGVLEPMPSLGSSLGFAPGARSVFRHESLGWLSWPGDVSAVRSAVPGNGGHYYVAGDGYPKQGTTALGGQLRRLGVPQPASALSVSLEGGDDAGDISRTSSYRYTCLVSMGGGVVHEGPPSPPTGAFDVLTGQRVRLTGFQVPAVAGVVVSGFRIYRASGGAWFFLREIGASLSSWTDEVSDADLSTIRLSTEGWSMPDDDARGITLLPNGIHALHRSNEVLLSPPFVPYAYPDEYRLSFQDTVVGLGHVETSIVVLTSGRPALLQGSSPASMVVQPVAFDQACVAATSITSTPYGVLYASPDGLCLVSLSAPEVVTRGVFTVDQWRAMGPSSLLGAYFEGRYYGFFRGTNRGFAYDFAAGDVVLFELPGSVTAVRHDAAMDSLVLVVAGSIRSLAAGADALTMRWRSGEFFTSVLVSPAALRVQGEQRASAPLTVRLFAGGVLRHALALTGGDPVRLPMSRAENAWTVEVEGRAAVFEIRVSTSIEELESGI